MVDDQPLRERIADHLVAGEARAVAKRAASPKATLVGVLHRKFNETDTSYIKVSDITNAYAAQTATQGEHRMTPRAVGHILRKELGLQTRKSNGVYVIAASERPAISSLAKRYGHSEN